MKTVVVKMKMPEDMKEKLVSNAKAHSLTLSSLMRYVLNSYLHGEKP